MTIKEIEILSSNWC